MAGKSLLAILAAWLVALPSAADAKHRDRDKQRYDRCWQADKRYWSRHHGPKQVSPFYNPGRHGIRTNYNAPYGAPVTFSPFSPTRIVYVRRCGAGPR